MALFDSARIAQLERQIAFGNQQYAIAQRELNQLRQQIISGNQKYAAIQQELNDLRQQQLELQTFVDAHGGPHVWEQDRVIAAQGDKLSALRDEEARLQAKLTPMRVQVKLEEAGFEDYEHPAKDSIELAIELREIRKEVQAAIRSYSAVRSADETTVPTTKAGKTKMAKDCAKLALTAFNAQVDKIIASATAANYDSSLTKIFRAAEIVERLASSSGVSITKRYIDLRARELRVAVDHLKAKAVKRELEREHKEELREQARAERELQAERERLEKEKRHYLNVLKAVLDAGDEAEAIKLREELVDIEKGLNDVNNRAANVRAGYVYVISNIGSFGERMIKIGMTRRLNPMDRVRELGDASVPFGFDVHALFFSEDAVGVETELHHYFADKRVNRVNTRREFFYATPAEVRDSLTSIAGNLLEFTEEPAAEQYRESLRLAAGD